jgi:hypothetical protein
MIRVHPNLNVAATIALALISSASGCKNQQTAGIANPFLAPNRVPPPSTRALLPGQAQPYYQGDPLPVTRNGATQPNVVSQTSAETEMPSAEENLAWTSPRATAPMSNAIPTRMNNPVNSPPNPSAIASNERAVTIPDDGDSLRFALPQPELAEPQPFTPSGPMARAAPQTPNYSQSQLQVPSSPSSRDIAQAAYTEPVITNSPSPAPSPWRSPQIAPASAVPPSIPAGNYYAPQPIMPQPIGQPLAYNAAPSLPASYGISPAVAANTMEVRLREVPSPPPRIRIPGSDTSVLTVGSADGFRPRSSMR